MKDFYQILGVSKDASEQDIKKAYRKLAMEHHPDRNPNNQKAAEEKFKEISEAYSVLSDTEKRRNYDMGGYNTPTQDFNGFGGFNDMEELFNSFFRRNPFGSSRSQNHGKPSIQGGDIKVETTITLEDVLNGTSEEFAINRQIICKTCSGSGAKNESDAIRMCTTCKGTGRVVAAMGTMHLVTTCNTCHGAGKITVKHCESCAGAGSLSQEEKIKVTIPAGVREGNVLRIHGKGHDSPTGNAPSGDLYIVILVHNHSIFERHDDDLYHEQKIPFTTAVLGGKVTVPILQKRNETTTMEVVINPGIADGQVLQFQNMGLPNLSTKIRGKQVTKFLIEVPALNKLSSTQKDLLRQFEESFK